MLNYTVLLLFAPATMESFSLAFVTIKLDFSDPFLIGLFLVCPSIALIIFYPRLNDGLKVLVGDPLDNFDGDALLTAAETIGILFLCV